LKTAVLITPETSTLLKEANSGEISQFLPLIVESVPFNTIRLSSSGPNLITPPSVREKVV
jgi:hypothetical protein